MGRIGTAEHVPSVAGRKEDGRYVACAHACADEHTSAEQALGVQFEHSVCSGSGHLHHSSVEFRLLTAGFSEGVNDLKCGAELRAEPCRPANK